MQCLHLLSANQYLFFFLLTFNYLLKINNFDVVIFVAGGVEGDGGYDLIVVPCDGGGWWWSDCCCFVLFLG